MKSELKNNKQDPDPGKQPKPDTKIPVKPDDDNDFTDPEQEEKDQSENSYGKEDPDRVSRQNSANRNSYDDPTRKGDPGRLDPSTPQNPALSGQGNMTMASRKTGGYLHTFFMGLLIIMLSVPVSTPAIASSANDAKTGNAARTEATVLISRLNEIKSYDVSSMSRTERSELRKEVKNIKHKLSELSGGVYLSVGALIIILLLLILLL
jgi:hypothetical protein